MKEFQIVLENRERRTLAQADIAGGTCLFYTEIGLAFGAEAVIGITALPEKENVQTCPECGESSDEDMTAYGVCNACINNH